VTASRQSPTSTQSWQRLAKLATQLPYIDALLADEKRNATLQLTVAGISADLSRQHISKAVLADLLDLAFESSFQEKRDAMLAGEIVNSSERRPALHTQLRAPDGVGHKGIGNLVQTTLARMKEFCRLVREGEWRGCSGKTIRTVVFIGIGGSHLGPELAVRALGSDDRLQLRFVANIDGSALTKALLGADPETTLFITASKSFSTLETLENSRSARSWFLERTGAPGSLPQHFVAISANVAAAQAFGIHPDNVFPMWDWVGGRYSLWSAVGLPVALASGFESFDALLAGARAMDQHFATAEPARNLPLLLALASIWNTNFLGAASHAVLCYDERLALLPDYLQQLEMESNGKRVNLGGEPVDLHTMPILWGGTGTAGQHAYHQLLHQGTRAFSADFIVCAKAGSPLSHHHDWLLAHAIAQGQAMMQGDRDTTPEKQVPGNHPTSTLILERLDPFQLGSLLALFEHKVYAQAVIWGINPFDQWGVELGKRLATPIFEQLGGASSDSQDASTRHLIQLLNKTGRT
jgi:glucose-6-phosphate isomerase